MNTLLTTEEIAMLDEEEPTEEELRAIEREFRTELNLVTKRKNEHGISH